MDGDSITVVVGTGATEPLLRSALVLALAGGFENDLEGGRFFVTGVCSTDSSSTMDVSWT